MTPHYYNEFDPYAVQWLRNLIARKLIPAGEVDDRSIADVSPVDLTGFRQCHFFAGIGGWALAARLAGWPEDRELWTGSCPCQPFSVAGRQRGHDDERHLWPHQLRLLRARRPAVWLGEQVAAAVGKDWLDGVLTDLAGIGYAGRAVVVPACAVDGPHRRDRIWIVTDRAGHDSPVGDGVSARLERHSRHADDEAGRAQQGRSATASGSSRGALEHAYVSGAREEREQRGGQFGGSGADPQARIGCAVANADSAPVRGRRSAEDASSPGTGEGEGQERERVRYDTRHDAGSAWSNAAWVIGHDGKARRVEPGIRLLAHGVPARVGRLRAYGNAIVPQVAAEVIKAYLDCAP